MPRTKTSHRQRRSQAEDQVLSGGGTMGALMRTYDWAASPFGPVRTWPACLRTAVSLALNSQFPTVIFWGPELRLLYNDAYLPILADKHPVSLGRAAHDVFPEVWSVIGPMLQGVLTTGEATWSTDLFLPLVHNGTSDAHYFTFSYSPIRDEAGNVCGVFCPVTETTARKQAEEELRASEERLRLALEAAHMGTWELDTSTGENWFSPETEALWGFAPETFPGTWDAFAATIHPDDHERVLHQWQQLATGQSPAEYRVEYRIIRPDGAMRWMEAVGQCFAPTANGPVVGARGVVMDITLRKEMAVALAQSQANFQRLVESQFMGIVVATADRLLDVNERFAQLLGYTREELCSGALKWRDLTPPEYWPLDDQGMDELRTRGECTPFEKAYRHKDGHLIPILLGGVRLAQEPLQWVSFVLDITERKNAEVALHESEAQLRAVLDTMAEGVVVFDAHGQILSMNPAALALHGFAADQRVTLQQLMDLFATTHLDGRPMTTEEWPVARALRGEEVRNCEFRVRHRQTGHTWVGAYSALPVRDAAGQITQVVVTIHDVTARVQAEAIAVEKQRILDALLDQIPEGITIADAPDVTIRWVSAYGRKLSGRGREAFIGRPAAEHGAALQLFHPDGVTPARPEDLPLTRAVQRGEVVTDEVWVLYRPDGQPMTILCNAGPIRDPQDVITGGVVVWRDITERLRLQRALNEMHRRLQLHLDNTPLAVIEWDSAFQVRLWSSHAEEMFGWTAEEVRGKCFTDWRFVAQKDEARAKEKLQEVLSGSGPPNGQTYYIQENRNVTKDGRVLDCVWYNSWLYDSAGTLVSTLSLVQDITARKQAEEEREQLITELQRINAEFQQFGYIVSHDLNEPLRTMRNYVQLLARQLQGKLDSDAEEYMAFVTDAAQRMQQMLTDLLAYTRAGQTPKFQPVDGEDVLAQVLQALQARITECGAVITHDPLPTVQGDATRVGQVLQNLIGNALKFCDAQPPRIHIAARNEHDHWEFSVRDNGIGIEPQQVGKLFQVFQRAHGKEYAGSGIGLAICKRIIEQHGGRIWVESKPREGSIFHFTISDGGGGGRTAF